MINDWKKSDLERVLEANGYSLLTNIGTDSGGDIYIMGTKAKYGEENVKVEKNAYDCGGNLLKYSQAVYIKSELLGKKMK